MTSVTPDQAKFLQSVIASPLITNSSVTDVFDQCVVYFGAPKAELVFEAGTGYKNGGVLKSRYADDSANVLNAKPESLFKLVFNGTSNSTGFDYKLYPTNVNIPIYCRILDKDKGAEWVGNEDSKKNINSSQTANILIDSGAYDYKKPAAIPVKLKYLGVGDDGKNNAWLMKLSTDQNNTNVVGSQTEEKDGASQLQMYIVTFGPKAWKMLLTDPKSQNISLIGSCAIQTTSDISFQQPGFKDACTISKDALNSSMQTVCSTAGFTSNSTGANICKTWCTNADSNNATFCNAALNKYCTDGPGFKDKDPLCACIDSPSNKEWKTFYSTVLCPSGPNSCMVAKATPLCFHKPCFSTPIGAALSKVQCDTNIVSYQDCVSQQVVAGSVYDSVLTLACAQQNNISANQQQNNVQPPPTSNPTGQTSPPFNSTGQTSPPLNPTGQTSPPTAADQQTSPANTGTTMVLGLAWYYWLIIGGALLLVIILVIAMATKKKKTPQTTT